MIRLDLPDYLIDEVENYKHMNQHISWDDDQFVGAEITLFSGDILVSCRNVPVNNLEKLSKLSKYLQDKENARKG